MRFTNPQAKNFALILCSPKKIFFVGGLSGLPVSPPTG